MKLKKGERFYSGPPITGRDVASRAEWLNLFVIHGPERLMTRALGFVLLAYTNSSMAAWPGQRTLMKALRVVPRTVIDHAWAGQAQGWWRIEIGQRGDMRQPGNIYTLIAPAHLVEAAAHTYARPVSSTHNTGRPA
jgi:hypothetical protein